MQFHDCPCRLCRSTIDTGDLSPALPVGCFFGGIFRFGSWCKALKHVRHDLLFGQNGFSIFILPQQTCHGAAPWGGDIPKLSERHKRVVRATLNRKALAPKARKTLALI